jgi:serine protease
MAAPHVAGVAALMIAANHALTADEVEAGLLSSATDLGPPGRDDVYGFGLVNANRAVRAAAGIGGGIPVLGLTPPALGFGNTIAWIDVRVANEGGGTLTLGAITTETHDGAPWLSAGALDADTIRVGVDRAGLAPGAYSGHVEVSSSGGTAIVQALTFVGEAPPPVNEPVFVLALDAASKSVVSATGLRPNLSPTYRLEGLGTGLYYLIAGTDRDRDGIPCEPGDACGAYPSASAPLLLALVTGERRDGLDLVVSPAATLRLSLRPSGFDAPASR